MTRLPWSTATRLYGQLVRSYADTEALIDDARVLALDVGGSGEPFIDLSRISVVAVDQSRGDVQQLSGDVFHVGSGVAVRLARAQAGLADGYQLQLKEGWRPIWVQERLWQANLEHLRGCRPELSEDELRQENARFVSPPGAAPPHSTGGAVDVILLHRGEEADMGWGFNQPGPGASTACPVSAPARLNRDLLARVLDTAGFINYPPEWWHWSYGDRYWAFQTGRKQALYGSR